MAECRYCARAVYPPDTTPGCELGLRFLDGRHGCIAFEREPGSDDDLGERSEIASKASESAYTARSTSTRHEGAG